MWGRKAVFLDVCHVFCCLSAEQRASVLLRTHLLICCSILLQFQYKVFLKYSRGERPVLSNLSLSCHVPLSLCVSPIKQSSTERQISHLLLPDVKSQMQFLLPQWSVCSYESGLLAICASFYFLISAKEPSTVHIGVMLFSALLLLFYFASIKPQCSPIVYACKHTVTLRHLKKDKLKINKCFVLRELFPLHKEQYTLAGVWGDV